MYCPECKQDFPGKFCPECGTKLIEVSSQNDINLNLSDNTAVLGGLNVTRNDSHNTTNFDQRIINTSNIINNNITKSNAQLHQETVQQFLEYCRQTFSGGLLDEEGRISLETERIRLGIEEAEAARLIEQARKSSGSRITTLGVRDAMILANVNTYIEKNNIKVLDGLILGLSALADNYNVDEVLCKYNMLLAALHPDKLIGEYEENFADEYWQTYWVVLAYMKCANFEKAEETIVKLGCFSQYPETNSLLLTAVSTYSAFGAEFAKGFVDAIVPELCSPLLHPFIKALFIQMSPGRSNEVAVDKEQCRFYSEYIVSLETPEAKETRRRAEEETCRKAEEERKRKAEEETRRKAEEERKRKAEEETRRRAEEERKRRAEEETRRKAEEERKRKAEEEARRRAEEERKRNAEEETRRKAEEERKRRAEEETRRKAEEERKRKAEEEARHRAEEERKRKAEEETRRRAEEERKRRAEEEAEKKRVRNSFETKTFNVNGVEFKMVAVEGGTFNMGCKRNVLLKLFNVDTSEFPIHSVTLSDYYIGETEVTQELWEAVMGSNPSHFKGDKNPVEMVSYNDCELFIYKLNTLLAAQLPAGRKFRLPSVAQWEFAARQGIAGRYLNYKYSGSDDIDKVAVYRGNSGKRTYPVKSKEPNLLGLYDMSGNVWEWCSDWFGDRYYSSSPQANPMGPSSGSYRVRRGGGWSCFALACRVTNRGNAAPSDRENDTGLRLAL